MPTRQCTTCGIIKPATLEFFAPHKDCLNGLNPVCRPCRRKYMREWKAKNAERIHQRSRELYAERHVDAQREKHETRLRTIPLHMRAQILRPGMIDRAKKRGIPFDRTALTVDVLRDWITRTSLCQCCGQPIDYSYKGKGPKPNSPSIDRFIPVLGYVMGNVALICWRCNNLKRDASAEELETIARWMRSHEVPPPSIDHR